MRKRDEGRGERCMVRQGSSRRRRGTQGKDGKRVREGDGGRFRQGAGDAVGSEGRSGLTQKEADEEGEGTIQEDGERVREGD